MYKKKVSLIFFSCNALENFSTENSKFRIVKPWDKNTWYRTLKYLGQEVNKCKFDFFLFLLKVGLFSNFKKQMDKLKIMTKNCFNNSAAIFISLEFLHVTRCSEKVLAWMSILKLNGQDIIIKLARKYTSFAKRYLKTSKWRRKFNTFLKQHRFNNSKNNENQFLLQQIPIAPFIRESRKLTSWK